MAELLVIQAYSNCEGICYECSDCNSQLFLPDFDLSDRETNVFVFCPYCGKQIITINNDLL